VSLAPETGLFYALRGPVLRSKAFLVDRLVISQGRKQLTAQAKKKKPLDLSTLGL